MAWDTDPWRAGIARRDPYAFPVSSTPNYRRRRIVAALGATGLVALAVGGVVGFANSLDSPTSVEVAAVAQPAASESPAPAASPTPTPTPTTPVSMSATGDIILGDARGRLPRNDGEGFFAAVTPALSADIVMGNMDAALTEDTGWDKCGGDTTSCYAFRSPPAYTRHLVAGGFDLINGANNHSWDYGPQGYANTTAALTAAGIQYTGRPGEIARFEVGDTSVAVVGYSPYKLHNRVTAIPQAASLVREADKTADIVVVQAHMGAEGSDKTNVVPGIEWYYGENRGDVVKFSRAMVDAGADLVVGHGPHVLRGMEFYNGKLIAYSLGNFAGGGRTLQSTGPLGLGGVLKVDLNPDGSWINGQFVGTYMDGDGWPQIDYQGSALAQVSYLSSADFGASAPYFAPDGTIVPPTPVS